MKFEMIFVLQKGYNYYLLIIDMSLASDLSAHHDHSSLCHSLARNLRKKKIKLMRLQITGNKKMHFTFASGSCLRWASRIASDTWSHILSVNIQNQAKEIISAWIEDLILLCFCSWSVASSKLHFQSILLTMGWWGNLQRNICASR